MKWAYNTRYPGIDDLQKRAKRKVPGFAFEYLEGGCNENVNLNKNISDLREVELKPLYLNAHTGSDLKTELFGHTYDAPFGVAPIGLQGLVWPDSPKIIAKAAFKHNIPFILSTVSTSSIEEIAEVTEGKAWFQLYHPKENKLRDALINRAASSGCDVLVILCDVPTFGYRPWDIRNGLGMPPKMTLKNILQIFTHPEWALRTLITGQPGFANMKPYMPKGMNLKQLGLYMNDTFSGRLNEEKIKPIREMWKGKLVIKGVASVEDTELAIKLGLDGVIVSNHGGRQIDAGESAVSSLQTIAEKYKDKITLMMDSGIRSGPDIARALASGACFSFLGRTFTYGAAALGEQGGDHTIAILKTQLLQVMEQLCCKNTKDFSEYLIRRT